MTPQDKQFLDAYIRLHDFEAEMLAIANKLFHSFIPVSKELEDLGEALKKVKNSFNDCTLMADKLCAIDYNAEEVSLEKLAKNQELTGKELLGYSDRIMKVYETVKELSAEVDKYNKANEDEVNNLYEVYSKIRTAHSVNWEKNTINIARFEGEYEWFLAYRSVNEDRRENLMDFCTSAIDNYATLTLRTNSLYDLWKEYLKRVQLIRAAADLHAQLVGFTNN